MSYSNDKYPLCKILKVYYSSLVNLKMLSTKEKNKFPVKKIQMKGIITSIPKTPQSFSAYSIDCFERLKAYYQLKKEKYYLGKDHIKTFYLKRKELKYDFKEWKSFMRNSIVSLFLASNLFYFIKNRKSDKFLYDTFQFIKYSGSLCLLANFIAQKQLNRHYKNQLLKYQ